VTGQLVVVYLHEYVVSSGSRLPNPRLQRTRVGPSGRRSPLSRQPLGANDPSSVPVYSFEA